MKQKEHYLQVQCIKYFRLKYPKEYYNLFAIPNGGHRNMIVAKKLKDEGVVSGVADLFLAISNNTYHGLFIELKIKPNKLTLNQVEFRNHIIQYGYMYAVVYNFDGFMEVIEKYKKSKI